MKKKLKIWMALLLTAAMLTGSLSVAFAEEPGGPPPDGGDGGMMGPPPGGGGGGGSAGQEFATYDEILESALATVDKGESTCDQAGVEVAEGGVFNETTASGVRITGGEMSNGIAINQASETDRYTIGGAETFYEVDGRSYNSVIQVNAADGNNDKGYEAVYGVGAAINTGELWIENSYIGSEGPRSTPLYGFSSSSPAATSVVVVNSKLEAHSDEIWMPPFKLLAGGARATLLMTRNNSWFYSAELVSNNWGALSQDSVDAYTYFINSSAIATEGGYGAYLTYGLRMYASTIAGGQYGLFLCGNTDVITDWGGAALEDEAAIGKLTENGVELVTVEGLSTIAAPYNAVVVHNSLPDVNMVSKAEFRHTVLSTEKEDLPDSITPMGYDDDFFLPGVDIIGSGKGCGASYFYSRNLYGSAMLIRSMNADFTLDNATVKSSNGVLLQSVVTYDPPSASGYLTPDQGATVPGITLTLENGEYAGDILHQDYQRTMNVTVGQDAQLVGAITSGTYAAWNDLWSEENLAAALTEDGYSPDLFNNPDWAADVQANLIRSEDTVYAGTENLGVDVTVDGLWVVTDTSTLNSLTVTGGSVTAPAGASLTIYVDCDAANSELTYNDAAGTRLDGLESGKTYENVVILVGAKEPTAPEVPAFTDVTEGDWFYEAVTACVTQGVVKGYPDGTFQPEKTITRGEAAKLIAAAMGLEERSGSDENLSDVSGHWAQGYINACVKEGILSGYPDGTFQPDKTITRAEMAKILASALKLTPGESKLNDVAGHWAANDIAACESSGVVTGYEDGTFQPEKTVTRAEAATMIARAFRLS